MNRFIQWRIRYWIWNTKIGCKSKFIWNSISTCRNWIFNRLNKLWSFIIRASNNNRSLISLARTQGTGLNLSTVSLRAKCSEVEGVECLVEGPYTGFALDLLWFKLLKSGFPNFCLILSSDPKFSDLQKLSKYKNFNGNFFKQLYLMIPVFF